MATSEGTRKALYMKISSQGSQGQHSPTYGFSLPQRDLAAELDLIDQEAQSGEPKDSAPRKTDASSISATVNEMQMIYDSQVGQFISIHEHESNVVVHGSMKFIDHNFNQALEFTTISGRDDPVQHQRQPWDSFWDRKYHSNNNLL